MSSNQENPVILMGGELPKTNNRLDLHNYMMKYMVLEVILRKIQIKDQLTQESNQ